jgi:hypothetical protein
MGEDEERKDGGGSGKGLNEEPRIRLSHGRLGLAS